LTVLVPGFGFSQWYQGAVKVGLSLCGRFEPSFERKWRGNGRGRKYSAMRTWTCPIDDLKW
jgi:hypothetical protein